jgi:ketosteroid isomerase-like protein
MRGMTALWRTTALLLMAGLAACATMQPSTGDLAREQVQAAERAFAKTMADRDFAAFQRFLSTEAIFFTGPEPLRGKAAVAGFWARYYRDASAPFSWEPDEVQVLDSGTLALSAGPVRDPQGRLVGRFSSVWRQEQPGVWRIVFDRGESAPAPAP